MKKLKVILGWVLVISAFCALVNVGTRLNERAESVCKKKGMILVQVRGKDYCTTGSREGL